MEAEATRAGDCMQHAELVHRQALAWAASQSRWTGEQRSAAEAESGTAALAGRETAVLGIPGRLWKGNLSDIRHHLWRSRPPYETPEDAPQHLRDAAASNWAQVRTSVTALTGNMARVASGLWWVRDEWSPGEITSDEWAELRDAAVRAVTATAPEGKDQAFRCRYYLATGCTAAYGNFPAWYYHCENSSEHNGRDAITLTTCPFHGTDYVNRTGRAQHLTKAHGIAAQSAERAEVDAQQTKELWDTRELRRASLLDAPRKRVREPAAEDPQRAAYEALAVILLREEELDARVRELEAENAQLREEADKARRIRDILR
jgi:hypothetical protein